MFLMCKVPLQTGSGEYWFHRDETESGEETGLHPDQSGLSSFYVLHRERELTTFDKSVTEASYSYPSVPIALKLRGGDWRAHLFEK